MLLRLGSWLGQRRHRKLIRRALEVPADPQVSGPSSHELQALVAASLGHWRAQPSPTPAETDATLQRLSDEHPSVFIFDIRAGRALARPKRRAPGDHPVEPVLARMYAKRGKQYGALLTEVSQRHRDLQTSLAIDLEDIPLACEHWPVFSFQRRRGGHNVLLPDVDFFHHAWYLTAGDDRTYGQKTLSAGFVGASTGGGQLTVEDIREHRSERLRLAREFQSNARVSFLIAGAVQCADPAAERLLRAEPYFSEPVAWEDQLQHLFLISVDGNGATCSRVVKALLSNSVLIKFESTHELYYFPLLQPGRHYLTAREACDVDQILSVEAARPGRHADVAAAGTAFARRFLSPGAVVAYTEMILLEYARWAARR